MGHYWSEVQDDYKADLQRLLPQIKPMQEQQPIEDLTKVYKGFTLIWEGSPSDFIQIIDRWASVPRNLLKTDNGTESGSIALWVANEWIDWCYYRAKNEYIPLGEQVWRAEDSEAIRRKLEEANEAAKKSWNERTNAVKFMRSTIITDGGIVPKD